MGPMRKDILDKAAWAWVDSTEPSSVTREHVLKAYRTQLPRCRPGSCRRNCRGSPGCLSGLGEQRWLSEPSEESSSSYCEDPNIDMRDSGFFIGLKNLGATCYVNSLLQLWFHNLKFREAIYKWDPNEDPDESQDLSKFPVTHVGHLQVLFANLEFSVRRFIDPSDFVHSLGLDTNQQQDAQEFSKLFISMLEDRLATQTKPIVHDMISKNFKGEYSYVTKCSKCQRESTRPSTFYELDLNIQGHRTLGDSLAEFLHEEKLEGANKYHCAVCGDKQDAVRCIRLKSLPPTLHLQLLRFVYDRSKGHKKKLNSVIQFPETLDMSQYLGLPPGSKIYHVSAVLLHMGSSAYSGHYIAHIKDSVSGIWHKYNDESVEKMEGKKLSLGSEEDGVEVISSKMKGRNQKCIKGFVNSKNAYMLVYTQATDDIQPHVSVTSVVSNSQGSSKSNGVERSGVNSSALEVSMELHGLAVRLRNKVTEQNKKFEEWTSEESNKRDVYKAQTEFHRGEMMDLFQIISVPPGVEKFDFISSEWLSKCLHEGLGDDSKITPIDNSGEICPHGRVDPSRVTNMKIISIEAANKLYKQFTGGPRVQSPEALCIECVANKCMEIRLRNKIASDGKEITNLLKYRMDETDPGYWVGKNTLKSWKGIALRSLKPSVSGKEELDNQDDGNKNENECEVKSSSTDFRTAKRQRDGKVSTSEDEENGDSDFNLSKSHNARKRGKISSKNPDKLLPQKRIHLLHTSSRNGNCDENAVSSSLDNGFDSSNERKIPPEDEDGMRQDDFPSSTSEDLLQDMKGGAASPEDIKEDRKDDENVDDTPHTFGFNDDAVCEHGNLNIDGSCRRLVPPRIWNIFTNYFPSAKEFPRNSQVCQICQERAYEGQVVKDTHRKVAQQQKECLGDLYLMRNRPNLDPAARKTRAINGTVCPVEGQEDFFIISQEFADRWKNFIGRRGEPPLGLLNEPLMCPHSRLLFNPADPEDSARRLVLVWPHEWDTLQSNYSVDRSLAGTRDLLTGEVTFNPEVCAECQESRREAQQMELCTYKRAKIFVRRVVPEDCKTEASSSVTAPPTATADGADPEFQASCALPSSAAGCDAIRRSARSRKPRGDKELTVSSDQTLLDLKVEIYKHFQVAPYDQHLSLDGRPLEGPENTLGSLNVYPRSIVLLQADEPSEDAAIMDDYIKSTAPEEGFKGTGLLSR